MKRIFVTFCFVLSSVFSNAQDAFNLSFNAGAGISTFRGDAIPDDFDSPVNFIIGVNLEKNLSNNIFLRTGLNYGKKAIEFDVSFFDPSDFDPIIRPTTRESSIETLSLPVLIGYKSNGQLKFIADAGPFISVIISEDNILAKSTDFGINASAGLEYNLNGSGAIRLEIVEELGLSDINDSQLDIQSNTIRTNRLSLQVGYVIGF